jgi:hypothetical protein
MSGGDWLTSYASLEGLDAALTGLSHRVRGGERMFGSSSVLIASRERYQLEFTSFFSELRQHLGAR